MQYRKTRLACFVGYVTQAVSINFPPLLFAFFNREYGISLEKISLLLTLTFLMQLAMDLLGSLIADRVGYRRCAVAAHALCALGLVLLGVLPMVMAQKVPALVIAALFYSAGSGMIEVIISPIIEACPSENKSGQMNLLHSFYCWGQAGVALVSTLCFARFGVRCWPILAAVWALVPLCNLFAFLRVPVPELRVEGGPIGIGGLLRTPFFWLLALMMTCSGAGELAMSQWASAFAETGLQVSKTVGDLLGPCLFALMMALSRVVNTRVGDAPGVLERRMTVYALLTLAGYLLAALGSGVLLPLLGCALVGFSIGLFWPGTFSLAARRVPQGGTALFALLALAGDLGCTTGPALVGAVSAGAGDSLRAGLLAAVVFPAALLVALSVMRGTTRKNRTA